MYVFPVRPDGACQTVCILAMCHVFRLQSLLLHLTDYFVPHSIASYDVLEISLQLLYEAQSFVTHQISLVEIFASFDHGFGVSNNCVIFNKTTSSHQSTAKALVLACFFPLRKHSLVIFSIYNASV